MTFQKNGDEFPAVGHDDSQVADGTTGVRRVSGFPATTTGGEQVRLAENLPGDPPVAVDFDGNVYEKADGLRVELTDEQVGDDGEIVATPAAEKKADELHVDLSDVQGSGADGKVLVSDVVEASGEGSGEQAKAQAASDTGLTADDKDSGKK